MKYLGVQEGAYLDFQKVISLKPKEIPPEYTTPILGSNPDIPEATSRSSTCLEICIDAIKVLESDNMCYINFTTDTSSCI